MNRIKYIPLFVVAVSIAAVVTWLINDPLQLWVTKNQIQQYPNKTVELIVSFKEGGGTDIGARLLAGYLEQELNQFVKIHNVDGYDGEVGFERLAKADPDGYTIGFINLPTFISLPIQRKTAYQVKDVQLIANYVLDPAVLLVRSDSPWMTFEEWLEECRQKPLHMTVSNNGVGASNHIAAAYLAYEAEIELTHVPFGGTTDMLKALEEGYVSASVAKVSEVAQGVQQGDFRVLASFTEERLPVFDDVPTLRENGYDISFGSARALAVPVKTPKEIVKKIEKAFYAAYTNPEHLEDAEKISLPLFYMDQEDVRIYIRQQEQYLREVLPLIGL